MTFVAGVKEAAPAHHHRTRPQRTQAVLNITPPETLANLSELKRTASTVVERNRMLKWLDDRIAASKRQPVAEVVTLTPILAGLLLERNPVNRPISGSNAGSLLADVSNQRWEFNGESIVVSDTGLLLDGQHRCHTVVKSGSPIQTVIVFGPKEQSRFTIDLGRPKSAPNFLSMKGYKNTAMLASAARSMLMYRARGTLTYGTFDSNSAPPTKTEVVSAVSQLKGLQESVDFAASAPKSLGSRSILAFAHYVIWKKSTREDADLFFSRLFTGDNLRRGDPILYCRNRLPDLKAGGSTGHNAYAELLFKCWNAHRRGELVTKMPLNGRLPKIER